MFPYVAHVCHMYIMGHKPELNAWENQRWLPSLACFALVTERKRHLGHEKLHGSQRLVVDLFLYVLACIWDCVGARWASSEEQINKPLDSESLETLFRLAMANWELQTSLMSPY